jgi:hypothetical protein
MAEIETPALDHPIDDSPVGKVRRVLEAQGVLAALRVLNGRAPHRYTGVYKYGPSILRNVHLVDAFDPSVTHGGDVPNEDAYCLLLADHRELAFGRAQDAPCPVKLASPVASYCGVLLVRSDGTPFGSLCHFDLARCEEPATQMPQLVAIAPEIMARLEAEGH